MISFNKIERNFAGDDASRMTTDGKPKTIEQYTDDYISARKAVDKQQSEITDFKKRIRSGSNRICNSATKYSYLAISIEDKVVISAHEGSKRNI